MLPGSNNAINNCSPLTALPQHGNMKSVADLHRRVVPIFFITDRKGR